MVKTLMTKSMDIEISYLSDDGDDDDDVPTAYCRIN